MARALSASYPPVSTVGLQRQAVAQAQAQAAAQVRAQEAVAQVAHSQGNPLSSVSKTTGEGGRAQALKALDTLAVL